MSAAPKPSKAAPGSGRTAVETAAQASCTVADTHEGAIERNAFLSDPRATETRVKTDTCLVGHRDVKPANEAPDFYGPSPGLSRHGGAQGFAAANVEVAGATSIPERELANRLNARANQAQTARDAGQCPDVHPINTGRMVPIGRERSDRPLSSGGGEDRSLVARLLLPIAGYFGGLRACDGSSGSFRRAA